MKQSSALEVQKLPFYIRIQEGSGDYRPLIKSVNGHASKTSTRRLTLYPLDTIRV